MVSLITDSPIFIPSTTVKGGSNYRQENFIETLHRPLKRHGFSSYYTVVYT